MGLQKTRDPKELGSMYLERTTARVAASMVLAPPKADAAAAAKAPRPVSSGLRPDLAADLATELEGLRGPARFFYDQSSWPASYQYALAASFEEREERAECSSRSTSRAEDRSSVTSSGEGRSSATSSTEGPSSKPKSVGRKQPWVCVMCDHCWKPVIPESRLYVLKCPKCLSDQPSDAELTVAELHAMAEQCQKVMAEREAAAAERRKSRLVERARHRMYDQPWTPQLANAHNRELALAHDCD